jgi:adenosine deaminase
VTWAPGVPEWSTDRSDTAGSAACTDPFTATFVQHLPKVELHLHLVGAVGPATLERLLEGPGDDAPPSPILGQPDEQGFLTTFRAVTSRVRRPEDVVALVEDAGHRLASTNVRYAEVTVTVASHLRAGIGPTELRDALDEGRRRVRRGAGSIRDWPDCCGIRCWRRTAAGLWRSNSAIGVASVK